MISLVDIAPTIASLLGIPMPRGDGMPISKVLDYLKDSKRLVLIIIDGLGYSLYNSLDLPKIRDLSFKCRCVSNHTTPAIASILTGYLPEKHGIKTTADASKSGIKSVPEIASEKGIKTAVILEREGAMTMNKRVDLAVALEDENILAYDSSVRNEVLRALEEGAVFVVAHFRAIDRYAHENRNLGEISSAAKTIFGHIDAIAQELDGGILVCGDHSMHGSKKNKDRYVPIIAIKV